MEWGIATVANKLKLLHREWDLTHPEEVSVKEWLDFHCPALCQS